MFFGAVWWLMLAAGAGAGAARWRWPEPQAAGAVRIDTKVRFVDSSDDNDNRNDNRNVLSDEVPFRQPTDTAGFYNRPPGDGRFAVHVEPQRGKGQRYRARPARQRPAASGAFNGNDDGTLDSLRYCRCVSTPHCSPGGNPQHACADNEYLCCYNAPNLQHNSEFFNEVDDERPMLLPSYTNLEGPFPPPPGAARPNDGRRQTQPGLLVGPGGPTGSIGVPNNEILGGDGATGVIGPAQKPNVLVGPGGPTGIIGPANNNRNPGIFGDSNRPSDMGQSESAQRGVLVGPGGPTGIIGPQFNRPVLVGPGGPTGIIGPRQQGGFGSQRRGVLVGPGGPTGIIGPAGFNQRRNPGVLVGPGGPTGVIGPSRRVLVGPGGPTGQIGPRGPTYGK